MSVSSTITYPFRAAWRRLKDSSLYAWIRDNWGETIQPYLQAASTWATLMAIIALATSAGFAIALSNPWIFLGILALTIGTAIYSHIQAKQAARREQQLDHLIQENLTLSNRLTQLEKKVNQLGLNEKLDAVYNAPDDIISHLLQSRPSQDDTLFPEDTTTSPRLSVSRRQSLTGNSAITALHPS